MKSPVSYFDAFRRRAVETVRTRHVYRGWRDIASAATLRLSTSALVRKFFPNNSGQRAFRIQGFDDPIHVRPANSDFEVWCEIFERSEYGPILKMGIRPDCNILDLGANIGMAAIYFSIHFPQCKIELLEPDAQNCEMIRLNCRRLIESGRVNVTQGFVAAKDGEASIGRSGDSWTYQKIEPVGDERVICVSIPTLCRDRNLQVIDLLKCDVEGTEAELFADCADWIGRVKNLAVEVHPPYGFSELYAALKAGGWNFHVVEEVSDRLTFLSAENAPAR